MDSGRNRNVESIFHAALAQDTPALRTAFLEGACGGDTALRARVEALLAAHAEAGDFLARPAAPPPGAEVGEGPGTRIGPYKLLQLIGEGGMGAVYMAEQERPVRRKVALKIIKLGMDTRQVIARFEAERQALAMTDHPNIAKVLDAGSTDTGRPYFVMELVRGISICDYCDQNHLSTDERLELFIHVCHAVQHAHMKGLIHRDLKPSNVMVTLHDGRPVPKIIDFGIAKATSQRLTEKTLFTEYGQFIGTPAYMSPEQAEMSGLDVDTRTDIYALGVLLYELLTGTTPVDPRTLKEAAFGEVQRIIREEEPPAPSTRVSTMGDELTAVASNRRIDARSLRQQIRGDLDWIVMKALDKDRTRRYESADGLAQDVRRFLDHEPVLAGPPSAAYKLRKFVRRHRVGVTAGSIAAAALIVGLTLAVFGFVQARRDRDLAQAARTRADAEAQRSRAISAFLQDQLLSVTGDEGPELTVEDVVERCEDLFGQDHAVTAGVLSSWAANLGLAGHSERATEALLEALDRFRSAFGPEHPAVATTLGALSDLYADARDWGRAERCAREALALDLERFGAESPQAANALDRLVRHLVLADTESERTEEIGRLWQQAVTAHRLGYGNEDRRTVKQLSAYGCWLYGLGRVEAADDVLTEAVERGGRVLGPHEESYFEALAALANLASLDQDFERAKQVMTKLLEVVELRYGPSSLVAARIKAQIGTWMRISNELDEAEAMLREAVAASGELPVGDPTRLMATDGLAQVLVAKRDVEAARPAFAQTMVEARACWGEDNPRFIDALERYARWRASVDGPAAGLPMAREAAALAQASLEPGHASRVGTRETLIEIQERADPDAPFDGLREDYRVWIADGRLLWGPQDRRLAGALTRLAERLVEAGEAPSALPHFADVARIRAANGEELSDDERDGLRRAAFEVAADAGRTVEEYTSARDLLGSSLEDEPEDPGVLSALGTACYRLGDYDAALAALQRADQLHVRRHPRGLPTDVAFLAMVQQRLGDAERARASLARLRATIALDPHSFADDERTLALLAEAEAVVESKGG